jgi:thymidylate synthase
MSANTSLITDATRAHALDNREDYTDAIAAHVAGDFKQHYEMQVHQEDFQDEAPKTISTQVLRLLVTNPDTREDMAVVVPILLADDLTADAT